MGRDLEPRPFLASRQFKNEHVLWQRGKRPVNLPRYIDSTEPEDLQDIDGHLRGGIPDRDLEDPARLGHFWKILPGVRTTLFKKAKHKGYAELKLPIGEVKPAIFGHAEFTAFNESATKLFAKWKKAATPLLKGFDKDGHPKPLIATIAEKLLATFSQVPEGLRPSASSGTAQAVRSPDVIHSSNPAALLDAYDIYQLPPVPEQTAIAEVLTDMDAELAGLEQRREKTRALKQAMMQELLTGRTRLI